MSQRTLANSRSRRSLNEWFRCFAQKTSDVAGSPWLFFISVLVVLAWAVSGPLFHFSDTWQLVINTGTTIVTFLMVFLIQNTQNRDAKAIHLKLDELIRSIKGARNSFVDLESLSDEQLLDLQKQFEKVRKRAEKDGLEKLRAGEVHAEEVHAEEVHAEEVHVDTIHAKEVKQVKN